MIEITDEMVQAYADATGINWAHLHINHRIGLAAVLAIAERDLAGPCSSVLEPMSAQCLPAWCELKHGHPGDHMSGQTRWKEIVPGAPGTWRCNTVERCFREDGHDGPHGFAGLPS